MQISRNGMATGLLGVPLRYMHTPSETLSLTDVGRRVASSVLSKHVLAEQMLTTLIGLDPAAAHAEACNWEHVISDSVEIKLRERFGAAAPCPFTGGADRVKHVDITTAGETRSPAASAVS